MDDHERAKWIAGLVEEANRVANNLAGLDRKEAFKVIKAIVDDADIVYGIFQDQAAPGGVGVVLIKGAHVLREVSVDGKMVALSTAAIPCMEREQAIACAQVWGDKTQ